MARAENEIIDLTEVELNENVDDIGAEEAAHYIVENFPQEYNIVLDMNEFKRIYIKIRQGLDTCSRRCSEGRLSSNEVKQFLTKLTRNLTCVNRARNYDILSENLHYACEGDTRSPEVLRDPRFLHVLEEMLYTNLSVEERLMICHYLQLLCVSMPYCITQAVAPHSEQFFQLINLVEQALIDIEVLEITDGEKPIFFYALTAIMMREHVLMIRFLSSGAIKQTRRNTEMQRYYRSFFFRNDRRHFN